MILTLTNFKFVFDWINVDFNYRTLVEKNVHVSNIFIKFFQS